MGVWKKWGQLGWSGVLLAGTGCLPGAILAPKEIALTVEGKDLVLPAQTSHSLEASQPAVRRLVITIHGANYNAQEAYNAVVVAMGGHKGQADPVCIIAPQFLRSSELPSTIPDNLLYWNNFPFRGTSSARYGPAAQVISVSVFDVLDQILGALTDGSVYPNLETIVVAGYSAGGQLVNRYAVAGRFKGAQSGIAGLHLRYLVMSPSSYLYFGPERDPDGDGVFAVPASGCPGYNDWGYGLANLWSYPAGTGLAVMREQYPKRFVFYLVGEEDNNPDDPSMATDCFSNLQGPHRLARAETYFLHLLETFGDGILDYQAMEIVPGAGHSFYSMLNSVAGRRYLLDRDESDGDGDGQTDWAEWIGGTDPEDPADRFRVRWDLQNAPAGIGLSWAMAPDRRYRLLSSGSPKGPFVEEAVLESEAGTAYEVVNPGADPRYFRIEASLH